MVDLSKSKIVYWQTKMSTMKNNAGKMKCRMNCPNSIVTPSMTQASIHKKIIIIKKRFFL